MAILDKRIPSSMQTPNGDKSRDSRIDVRKVQDQRTEREAEELQEKISGAAAKVKIERKIRKGVEALQKTQRIQEEKHLKKMHTQGVQDTNRTRTEQSTHVQQRHTPLATQVDQGNVPLQASNAPDTALSKRVRTDDSIIGETAQLSMPDSRIETTIAPPTDTPRKGGILKVKDTLNEMQQIASAETLTNLQKDITSLSRGIAEQSIELVAQSAERINLALESMIVRPFKQLFVKLAHFLIKILARMHILQALSKKGLDTMYPVPPSLKKKVRTQEEEEEEELLLHQFREEISKAVNSLPIIQ